MSCKVNMTNGVSLSFDNHLYAKTPALDASVKFAGEEAKDRLYESKHKKKLVRVLTVIAYVFFVSLAAIMLSLYYIFIWSGDQKSSQPTIRVYTRCDNTAYAGYQQPPFNRDSLELEALRITSKTTLTSLEKTPDWHETNFNVVPELTEQHLEKSSPLLRKLVQNKFPNSNNYSD